MSSEFVSVELSVSISEELYDVLNKAIRLSCEMDCDVTFVFNERRYEVKKSDIADLKEKVIRRAAANHNKNVES